MRTGFVVLVIALLAALPSTALGDTAAEGTLEFGPGPLDVTFKGTNTGDQAIRQVDLTFVRVDTVTIKSAPAGATCGPYDTPSRSGFSCFMQNDQVWAPTGLFAVGFTTEPRLPDDAQAQMTLCASPCGQQDVRGPFAVPGPVAPEQLQISKTMEPEDDDFGPDAVPGDKIRISIRVRNVSGRTLENVSVADRLLRAELSAFPGDIAFPVRLGEGEQRSVDGNTVSCGVDLLSDGESLRCIFFARLVAEGEGFVSNDAIAGARGVPNVTASARLRHSDPRARIEDADGRSASGTAAPVFTQPVMRTGLFAAGTPQRTITRVEVAVRRTDRRHTRKRRCTWLASRRPTFRVRRRARNGKCDRAVWLRATGTRSWRFQLARNLPRGSYVMYARARNAAGGIQRRFTAKDKSLLRFRIR
jgi:hypothetical protein